MSRDTDKIGSVAPPKKDNDAKRTLRYPSLLMRDLDLLAWVNHRSANDEVVVAIEAHVDRNRTLIEDARRRRGGVQESSLSPVKHAKKRKG